MSPKNSPNRRARVFLLGPSHHVYTRKCLLSPATHYCTPLGAYRTRDTFACLRCLCTLEVSTMSLLRSERLLPTLWAGDAEVDLDINRELEATGAFEYMDLDVDEVGAPILLLQSQLSLPGTQSHSKTSKSAAVRPVCCCQYNCPRQHDHADVHDTRGCKMFASRQMGCARSQAEHSLELQMAYLMRVMG